MKSSKSNEVKQKDMSKEFVKKALKLLHIEVSEKTENLFVQIFKFAIVGVVATVIDFLFLYIFKEFFKLNTIVSNTLSFLISVIYNYIASVKWVFDVNKEKDAKKQISKINILRCNHYKHYTSNEWGNKRKYDLCINSDSFGVENAADVICQMVKNI